MCGILTAALPVIGAIGGSLIPGLGTVAGAALGGALGGATSGYIENGHTLGGALTGGLTGAGFGAAGAGIATGIGNGLSGLGSAANEGADYASSSGLTSAFDTAPGGIGSVAGGVSGATTGGLETNAGGSSMFGASSGTGTALGDTSGSLGTSGIANTSNMVGADTSGFGGAGQGGLSSMGGVTADPTASAGASQFSMPSSSMVPQTGVPSTGGLSTNPDAQSALAGNTGTQSSDPNSFFNQTKPYVSLANVVNSGVQKYQQGQAAKDQLNQINNLYSPNSAYSQQMQTTLQRQGAQNGTLANGGTRAVELAAALTAGKAQALNGSNYSNLANSAATNSSSIFNGLYNMYGTASAAPKAAGDINTAWQGLSSLFS